MSTVGKHRRAARQHPLPRIPKSARGQHSHRQLTLEQLEDRRLLSIDPFPTPLSPVFLPGSLVYGGETTGHLPGDGELAQHTIDLDQGHRASLLLQPASGTQIQSLELTSQFGTASQTASDTTAPIAIENTPVNFSATYTISAIPASVEAGDYSLKLVLGASFEHEAFLKGAENNALAAAENIDASSISLDDPNQSPQDATGATRLAVTGQLAGDDVDAYQFTLEAGAATSLVAAGTPGALLQIALFSSDGQLLARSGAETDGQVSIRHFVAPSGGTYYATIKDLTPTPVGAGETQPADDISDEPGAIPRDYTLLVTRSADFALPSNTSPATAQVLTRSTPQGTSVMLGSLPAGGEADYLIDTQLFDNLLIGITRPNTAIGEPVDTSIEVYDADGNLVVQETNFHGTLPVLAFGGRYRVVVSSSGGSDYVLTAAGAEFAAPPLLVTSSTPADAQLLSTYPATYDVHFSEPLRLDTVDANDLTVDGVPALAVSIVDLSTLQFTLAVPASENGAHDVAMGDGAISGLSGQGLSAFTASFQVSTLAPAGLRVVGSTVTENAVLTDFSTVTFYFSPSAPLDLSGTGTDALGPEDVQLQIFDGHYSYNWQLSSFVFSVDAEANSITVGPLPYSGEGAFTLRLISSATGFRDIYGNLLDGAPSTPLPSGDNVMGDDFVLHFSTNDTAPSALVPDDYATSPSLISTYGNSATDGDSIFGPGDVDLFTLNVTAGERVSLWLRGGNDYYPNGATFAGGQLELLDPLGQVVATRSAPGAVLLSTAAVTLSGQYTVRVSSADSVGAYSLIAMLDGAWEQELVDQSLVNDTQAAAQDLDETSLPLVGSSDRLAVRGRLLGIGDRDFYALTLAAGQAAAFVGTAAAGSLPITLQLYDSLGRLLGESEPQVDGRARLGVFTAPVAGTYYVAASGTVGTAYDLTITRGATMDRSGPSQDITDVPLVLGFANGRADARGPVRVAMIGGGNAATDLNYHSYFNFQVTPVAQAALSLQLLANYDVVVIGGTITPAAGSILRQWAEAGGGIVSIGPTFDQSAAGGSPIVPFGTAAGFSFSSSLFTSVDARFSDHPVTRDVGVFLLSSPNDEVGYYPNGSLAPGAAIIGTINDNRPGVIVGQAGLGRTVWLGVNYFAGVNGQGILRPTSQGDQLLEQAVAWAANTADQRYTFEAQAGDVLAISTTTPLDSTIDHPNPLVPVVRLFDPNGHLVVVDERSASDGKNVQFSYSVAAPGTYRISLSPSDATNLGPFTLRVQGAAGLSPGLRIISSSVPDGDVLQVAPDHVRVVFSNPLLLTSIDATDFAVDGTAAQAVTVVDQHTLEFQIAGLAATNGSHTLSIGAGVITGLNGQGVAELISRFTIDHVGPRVVASSIASGAALAIGPLSYKVTFDEPLAVAGLGPEDVTLVNRSSGLAIVAQSLVYDATTKSVTVQFPALDVAEYTLTLLASATGFRDVAGNLLDGSPYATLPSGDGIAGDPFAVDFSVVANTIAPFPAGFFLFDPTLVRATFQPVSGFVLNSHASSSYTLDLNALQTLSIVLTPQDPGMQARLDLLDPSQNVVGTATAVAAGGRVLLQTAPVAAAGTYTLRVTTVVGGGAFQLDGTMNATVEAETALGLAGTNDSPASAEGIDASSFSLLENADRLAVRGRIAGAADHDFFSIALTAGQPATVVLFAGADARVALRDPSGVVVALGTAARIDDFIPTVTGTYTVEATATTAQDYNLIALRGAAFYRSNGNASAAQEISLTNQVLGRQDSPGGDNYRFSASNDVIIDLLTPLGTSSFPVAIYNVSTSTLVQSWPAAAGPRHLVFTPPVASTYRLVVGDALTFGAMYDLRLSNTAPAAVAQPIVTQTTPANFSTISVPPSFIEFHFSEAIRTDSVLPSDLTIDDGATVTGVQFVDGQTVRFLVNLPAHDATYRYALANSVLQDLQGSGNPSFNGQFTLDTTGPRVVSQSVGVDTSGALTFIRFTFSEDIDSSTFRTSDIARFVDPLGRDLRGQIFTTTAGANVITVYVYPQALGGTYELDLGPDIRDFAGNQMDQNGDGTAGQATDAYFARVSLSLADLVPVNITVPATARFQSPFTVGWTIANAGAATAAAPWTDRVWLSRDTILDSHDIQLDLRSGNSGYSLAPGGSYASSKSTYVFLDPTLVGGDYYVLVETDGGESYQQHGDGKINESNEANNILVSSPIRFELPDLVVSDVQVVSPAIAGQESLVSWTVTNQGNAAVPAGWIDTVSLSNNSAGTGALSIRAFQYLDALEKGASVRRTQSLIIPSNAIGDRWVVVATGAGTYQRFGNDVAVDADPLQILAPPKANLVVTQIVVPNGAISGQQVVVQWTVTNTGNAPTEAAAWRDNLYLSLDTELDGAETSNRFPDVLLGTIENPSYLGPGQSYTSSLTVTLPEDRFGNVYFLVKTDSNNAVNEANDADNISAGGPTPVQLTPPPDLQVDRLVSAAQGFEGQPLTVNWTVSNHGNNDTSTNRWTDRIWLSTDQLVSEDDILLSGVSHQGALAVGGAYSSSVAVTLPEGAIGSYYILVSADAVGKSYGTVFEGALEDNNVLARPVSILAVPKPDLEVTSVVIPDNLPIGSRFVVQYTVTNTGPWITPASVTNWTDRAYLSTTPTLDVSTARLLGEYTRKNPLAAEQSYTGTIATAAPFNMVGHLYVIVVTDATQRVSEDIEGNNITAAPVDVLNVASDLQLTNYLAPASASSGGSIPVQFTAANLGTGATLTSNWEDNVVISLVPNFNDAASRLAVTRIPHSGLLLPGASYTQISNAVVPSYLPTGDYYVFVVLDAFGQVGQPVNRNRVSAPLLLHVTQSLSDLHVTNVTAPASAVFGQTIQLGWTVENLGIGNATTGLSTYEDTAYLSTDDMLDAADTPIWRKSSGAILNAQQSLSTTINVPLGSVAPGTYRVIVQTDRLNAIAESDETNNIGLGPMITIQPKVVPDLAVTDVQAPTAGYTGQTIDVRWTVSNSGGGSAFGWDDAIYLSLDQNLDLTSDVRLGMFRANVALATGTSTARTAQVDLPAGLTGIYYVFVVADPYRDLGETARQNNAQKADTPLGISLAPVADLLAGTFTVPANAEVGATASITYSVTNQGANSAVGSWYDALYLSKDDVFSAGDVLIGRVLHRAGSNGLPSGSSYSETVTAVLPGVLPGDYRVILRSDIRNSVPEDDESNNFSAAVESVQLDAPELQFGVPHADELQPGFAKYYKVDIPAGVTVAISVTSDDGTSVNELYVKHGAMPSRGRYDFAPLEPIATNPQIVIPESQPGTYYVLVYDTSSVAREHFTVLVHEVPFSITSVSAGRAGNVGSTTVAIRGALFTVDTTFELVAPDGAVVHASRQEIQDAATAYATFDLRGRPVGEYDVRATRPGGLGSTLSHGLTVVEGAGAHLDFAVIGPSLVNVHRTIPFTLQYANSGDSDLSAVLFEVASSTHSLIGRDRDELVDAVIPILGLSSDGPLDVLRSGEYQIESLYFSAPTVDLTTDITVSAYTTSDPHPINWNSVSSLVSSARLADPDWPRIWQALQARIGTKMGDFVRMLGRNAAELPDDWRRSDPHFALDLEIGRAKASLGASISGQLVPTAVGLDLAGQFLHVRNLTTGETFATFVLRDNSFVFESVTPGEYAFDVTGAVTVDTAHLVVESGEARQDILRRVAHGATLSGFVRASSTGQPVSAARIEATGADGSSYQTTTDGQGFYLLPGMTPGTYSLHVTADGLARGAINDLDITDTKSQDLLLAPQSLIRGSINLAPGGDPDATFTVSAVNLDAPTGSPSIFGTATGSSFSIAQLPAGHYRVTISGDGYYPAELSADVGPGQSLQLGTIHLALAARISGQVFSSDPTERFERQSVMAYSDGQIAATATVDADNRFVLTGLADGVYTLRFGSGVLTTSQTIAIVHGADVTGVVLRASDGGQISGTVRHQGIAVPFATVWATDSAGRTVAGTSDSQGKFRLGLLQAGLATLFVGNAASAGVPVTVIEDEIVSVDLAFNAGTTLTGTLLDELGAPVSGAAYLTQDGIQFAAAATDAAGRFRFLLAHGGTFTLSAFSASAGEYVPIRDISLNSGDAVTESLTLGDAAIDVHVTDSAQPLAETTVQLSRRVDGRWQLVRVADTDPQGMISIRGLLPGDYQIRALQADGRGGNTAVTLSAGQTASVAIACDDQAVLGGIVRDASGAILANARVLLSSTITGEELVTFSGTDGTYRFANLSPGTYTAVVLAEGFRANLFNVSLSSAAVARDVVLATSNTLFTGRIIDTAGHPVGAALLEVRDAQGQLLAHVFAEPDGTFRTSTADGVGLTVRVTANGALPLQRAGINIPANAVTQVDDLVADRFAESLQLADAGGSGLALRGVGAPGVLKSATNPPPDDDLGFLVSAWKFAKDVANAVTGFAADVRKAFADDFPRSLRDNSDIPLAPPACATCEKPYARAFDAMIHADNAYVTASTKTHELHAEMLGAQLNGAAYAVKVGDDIADLFLKFAQLGNPEMFAATFTEQMVADESLKVLSTASKARAATDLGKGFFDAAVALKELRDSSDNLEAGTNLVAVINATVSTLVALDNAVEPLLEGELAACKGLQIMQLVGALVGLVADVKDGLVKTREIVEQALSTENDVTKAVNAYEAAVEEAYVSRMVYIFCQSICPDDTDRPPDPFDNPDDKKHYDPLTLGSRDPNDMVGPASFGNEHWVNTKSPFLYTINFENEATATAPAQKVVVTQQLDTELDPRSFRLGDFGWGDLRFSPAKNSTFYSTQIRPTADSPYVVDVVAYIDIASATAFWTFSTIDPMTGEAPLDPTVGFLAINDGTGSGQGFVSYTVKVRAAAVAGDRIDSQARIVFDTNPPIDTPAIFHTLDNRAPTSGVLTLPAEVDSRQFTVAWSGSDGQSGAGIANFDVYMATDGGPFVLWLSHTTQLQADFIGVAGHQYAFYAVATDNVDNREVPSGQAQAQTVISRFVPLAGDVNGDGVVNSRDVALVAGNWASSSSAGLPLPGDANGDGVVNSRDIALIASHWLEARGTFSSASSYRLDAEPEVAVGAETIGTAATTLPRQSSMGADAVFTPDELSATNVDEGVPRAMMAATIPAALASTFDGSVETTVARPSPTGGLSATVSQRSAAMKAKAIDHLMSQRGDDGDFEFLYCQSPDGQEAEPPLRSGFIN